MRVRLLLLLTALVATSCATNPATGHRELSLVIPAFVRRALDDRYGRPAAERIARVRERVAKQAPSPLAGNDRGGGVQPSVRRVRPSSLSPTRSAAPAPSMPRVPAMRPSSGIVKPLSFMSSPPSRRAGFAPTLRYSNWLAASVPFVTPGHEPNHSRQAGQ